MMEASLDCALAATNDRTAFGSKTIDFQGLLWLLADVATDLHAARLLFSAAASELDRGERASVDAAHAKKFAGESRNEWHHTVYAIDWRESAFGRDADSASSDRGKGRPISGRNDRNPECRDLSRTEE
ncbi:hypothetical protein IVA80_09465 [Bradyrhizobium sp. 139]|uniref:acyl-CoA dehydrogenase family protein n=1 Tax=Bradyrhizobium sp. 139 TaxID=2782616 RepID=UPI001FF82437|nr:acyl-CoA dehydrogenase family protein [Bradyrhizobium sp. 139]MCK1741092.1 hypothetical protein [Bradyrhizobium sp. 139]